MPVETGINRLLDFELKGNKDQPNGYPSLDAGTKIPIAEIPDLSGAYLPLAGGTMAGNINMNTNQLIFGAGGLIQYQFAIDLLISSNFNLFIQALTAGNGIFIDADDIVSLSSANSTIRFKDSVVTPAVTLAELFQFIGQSDTPANYAGAGSKLLKVNAGATAVEFVTDDKITAASLGYWRRIWHADWSSHVGTWKWTNAAGQTTYSTDAGAAESVGYFENATTHANGDYAEWTIYLPVGTYNYEVVSLKSSNAAILQFLVDGSQVFNQDCYAAVEADNQAFTGQFVITSFGAHALRLKANGKNTLSSTFFARYSKFTIEKVA